MSDLFSPISVLSLLSAQKAQKNLNESKDYLKNDFRGIVRILSLYNPLEVMKMSLWEERKVLSSGTKDALKRRSAVLLPIILQSIAESDMLEHPGSSREIREKDWERIKELSDDVVRRVIRLIDSFVAIALSRGEATEESAEGMRLSIESRLLPDAVDDESLERDVWVLRSLLEEVDDFSERVGTDYISFTINVQNIAREGLHGIDNLVREVARYSEEYSLSEAQLRASGDLDGLSEQGIFNLITEKNHWEGRAQRLTAMRDGYELFMPSNASSLSSESFLPYTMKNGMLDLTSFLEMGYWPAERYPFIEYNGKLYSFVGKHIPSFMAVSSSFDRYRAASTDVLSIFSHSDWDVDTYTYDGNKIEISVLPSVLDVNPILDPSSYSDIVRRRREELAVKRKPGHKKLVVDSDMREDMKKDNDVLFISSGFLCRATVDRGSRKELLSSLLGNLELPEGDSAYTPDVVGDEIDNSPELPNDDVYESEAVDDCEYMDGDEDEIARKIDERYEHLELIEYEKPEDDEDLQAKIEKYSLTPELIERSKEAEEEEIKIEDALDEDIFDDSDEDERLDDIGPHLDEESEFFETVEASDEYEREEETEEERIIDEDVDNSQLDFFSILDDDAPEPIEDSPLKGEKQEAEEAEEEREEPSEDEVPLTAYENELIEEADNDFILEGDELPKEDTAYYLDDESEVYYERKDQEDEDDSSQKESDNNENSISFSSDEPVAYPVTDEDTSSTTEESISDGEDGDSLPEAVDENEREEKEDEEVLDEIELDADSDVESEDDASSLEREEEVEEEKEDEEILDEVELDADSDVERDDDNSSFESEEENEEEIEEEKEDEEILDEIELDADSAIEPEDDNSSLESEEENEEEIEEEKEDEEILDEIELDADSAIEPEDDDSSLESEEENEEEIEDEKEGEEILDEIELDADSDVESEDDALSLDSEEEKAEKAPSVSWFAGMGIEDEAEDQEDEEEESIPLFKDTEEERENPNEEDDNSLHVADLNNEELFMRDDEAPESDFPDAPNEEKEEKEEETSIPVEEKPSDSMFSAQDVPEENGDEESPQDEDESYESGSSYVLADDNSAAPLSMTEESLDDEIEEKADGIVYAIYKALGKDSAFADFIRDSDHAILEDLEDVIRNCWSRQQVAGKDKLFNIEEYSLSILLAGNSIRDELRMSELLNNAGGVMYSRGSNEWKAVIVYINSSYSVEEAMEKKISKESFSPSDWKRVTYIGEQMRKK